MKVHKILKNTSFVGLLTLSAVLSNAFITKRWNLKDVAIRPVESPRKLSRETYSRQLSKLRNEFGGNKHIASEVELECLAALSFYPELKDTRIIFDHQEIAFTMQTQPRLDFLYKNKKGRSYCITINSNKGNRKGLAVSELSFSAVAGWIGHELAHIADYERLNAVGILGYATNYLLAAPHRWIERRTDEIAIQHGLGYPLLEGVEYLLRHTKADKAYKQGLIDNYLSPQEILLEIRKRQPQAVEAEDAVSHIEF